MKRHVTARRGRSERSNDYKATALDRELSRAVKKSVADVAAKVTKILEDNKKILNDRHA